MPRTGCTTTVKKERAPQVRLRNAVFTWNNPRPDAAHAIAAIREIVGTTFAVIGEEVGDSGTPHLQGFLEFDRQIAFSVLHRALGKSHIEARKGTPTQAAEYCRKGEQTKDEWTRLGIRGPNFGKNARVHEWGTISGQGVRSDLEGPARLFVEENASIRRVALAHPEQFIKYHKGMAALRQYCIRPRDPNVPPRVTVFWGKTGSGKSRRARQHLESLDGHDDEIFVWGPAMGSWFDGYDGNTRVVFEEFRGQLPFGMMLDILDRYTCKVQYKGGMTPFVATDIVITSPKPPQLWYSAPDCLDRLDQLTRRVTSVVCLDQAKGLAEPAGQTSPDTSPHTTPGSSSGGDPDEDALTSMEDFLGLLLEDKPPCEI